MGDVYCGVAARAPFATPVALKLLRDEAAVSGAAARLQREQQILERLDHPHVAKVLGGGVGADGLPYLVMELIVGLPIDVYCQRNKLSISQRLRLFEALARVVHDVHGQGVVHADLKPSNVLVTRDGQPKLVDFGIAEVAAASRPVDRADAPPQPLALTLAYASPEQVQGGALSPASDLYSLGVLMYGMLAGVGPYGASLHLDAEALADAVCEREPVPPSRAVLDGAGAKARRLAQRLRGDLDAIVLTALRKLPEARYGSAARLADDVRRHLARRPVSVRPLAWVGHGAGWLAQHCGVLVGKALSGRACPGFPSP
ncbi:serine/threonine-protein kinase [Caldimonas brevitalea]|uniref:Serine/threonine protein kinase n=1 Tax=Caldimonas brevitalea TaxID=413882 RepID=A0A0G3BC14_9BURK|nr:serine/threonine protein kinase [Caldimonas brevitalea]